MKEPSENVAAANPHHSKSDKVPDPAPVAVFLNFTLDAKQRRLERNQAAVELEPKGFDMLDYLLRHRDRVVSKAELMDVLWPDAVVTPSSLTTCAAKVRRALGDDAGKVIKSFYGRGYRFIAECEPRPPLTATSRAQDDESSHDASADGGKSHFFGRRHEMAILQQALRRAHGGRAQLVLIAGEQGIGKTRLVEELCARNKTEATRALVGHCFDYEATGAFWPWAEIVRRLTETMDPALLRSFLKAGHDGIVSLAPDLAPLLTSQRGMSGDPSQERFRLFDSIGALLRQEARRNPLILVVEDLHWADKASLLLLHFLARTLNETPILLVATYRANEGLDRGDDFGETLGRLQATPQSEHLVLHGLPDGNVARLIQVLAGHAVPVALVNRIIAESEGNPFFVEQLVQNLFEEGRLEQPEVAKGRAPVWVPQVVHGIIEQRAGRLGAGCREVLSAAAVIGRVFELSILARAVAAERGHPLNESLSIILGELDEAVSARLLQEVGGNATRYQFSHAMMHEGIYNRLGQGERSRWHWRVGEALEAESKSMAATRQEEIARHFVLGVASGSVDRAIAHCTRAAQIAGAGYAFEAAAQHYRDAIDLLRLAPLPDRHQHAELNVALAEVLSKLGELAAAETLTTQAAATAHELVDPELLARAALANNPSPVEEAALRPERCALLEQALAALPDTPSPLRAKVLTRLAYAYHFASDHGRAREHFSDEALQMAERLGDPATELWALDGRHHALMDPAHNHIRLEIAPRMIELASRLGQRDLLASAHAYRAWDSAEIGRLDSAAQDMAIVADLGRQLHDPTLRWRHALWVVMEATVAGQWDLAMQRVQDALALGIPLDPSVPQLEAQAQYLTLGLTRWKLTGMEAEALRPMIDSTPFMPALRVMLAYVHFEEGRFEQAVDECERCLAQGIETIPWDARWLSSMAYLGVIFAETGHAERAAQIYPLLTPYRDLISMTGFHGSLCFGAVARCLGSMAAALNLWAEAEQHFAIATTLHTQMQAPPWLAATYFDHARMLYRWGRKRDQVRAASLREQARALASNLDMPRLLARIERLGV